MKKMSDETREWLREFQSKGGKARAAKLSPRRRKQIARKAALARHRKPKPE